MRFLADESCDFAVVRALRVAGYDVVAISEAGSGMTDQKVIELARDQQRVVITEDKDFGQLVHASAPTGLGVILLRFPARARSSLGQVVVNLVEQKTQHLQNSFTVIRPGRIRISHPSPLT